MVRFRARARPAPLGGRIPKGGGAPLRALLDLPGLARVEQLHDIARATLGDGLLLLVDQDLLVRRLLLAGEDPERNRVLGRPELRQDQRRGRIGLVVDPYLL